MYQNVLTEYLRQVFDGEITWSEFDQRLETLPAGSCYITDAAIEAAKKGTRYDV